MSGNTIDVTVISRSESGGPSVAIPWCWSHDQWRQIAPILGLDPLIA